MESFTRDRLQAIFVSANRWVVALAVVASCLLAGLALGWLIAYLNPLLTTALIAAIVLGLLMLRDLRWCFFALVGVICLLPFAAIPLNIGFSPTLLDLVLGVTFLVWFSRVVTGQEEEFIPTPLALPLSIFIILALASFVAGLAHASLSARVLRRFAETLMGIALFFVAVNSIRRRKQLEQVILLIILAGFAAALVGVVLYFLPRELTVRLLSALGRFDYPTGWSVLRFIRDDSQLPMRATSTSIDPNALGGMLILVISLATTQLFAPHPLIRRKWLAPMLAMMVLCLFLTYSRGSMIGLGVGLLFLGIAKYRRLLLVLVLAGLLVLSLPQAQGYIEHFLAGVRGQDLATRMRLGEYKDAFILIRRYPWIGVGFAGTPDIDLYIGVSSLYLLIAEEMGLVGLACFLVIVGIFFVYTGKAWRRMIPTPHLEPLLLGLQAALVSGLTGGILDHYLFSFRHAVAFFWLFMGLGMAAARMGSSGDRSGAPLHSES
ncbi:MAG: O-antigen ligase family protein [Chloroflexota bacterium]|nr:O-antigen ligase family protein [Chloroflexota bacterium]